MVIPVTCAPCCSYRLLFKIASTFISHIITFSYDVYACDSIVIIIDVHPTHIPLTSVIYSIVIIIDVHPTHIPLTHGFQGNKHVVDVNDPRL